MGNNALDSTPRATHESGANQAGSFFTPMKPPLSFTDQLELMRNRGLTVGDEELALRRLSETNYYRLRGYWLTYELNGRFIPGTTFDSIWDTYELDCALRTWVWETIAPIEIKARTLFAYHMSMECGALAHEDNRYFKNTIAHAHSMESLTRERNRALRDGVPCVVHNIEKYGDLPIWAAVEIMSMGTVSQLYGNLDSAKSGVAKSIANGFGVKPFILKSWLRHLTYIRNICGHHSRLYNRIMTTRANLLKRDSRHDSDKEFPTFLVLKRIYEQSWPKQWPSRLNGLDAAISKHGGVSLQPMRFPEEWRDILK
ncbi:Abi family protein [Collinsella intestinalis]|uniref:Abi family protein n=1 Tax=Collinsella intestinalis TaxID=147207 RepID=UPI0025A3E203|nr:Abi family protein [Collinsella intestinalis]MDM8163045.1 Abi family protein [Collinsella intestinalis]